MSIFIPRYLRYIHIFTMLVTDGLIILLLISDWEDLQVVVIRNQLKLSGQMAYSFHITYFLLGLHLATLGLHFSWLGLHLQPPIYVQLRMWSPVPEMLAAFGSGTLGGGPS